MIPNSQPADLGPEREIDLSRLFVVIRSYWWIALVGLVAGAVLGGLYALSVRSKTVYTATATIARGQAFNPSGTQNVLGYQTNLLAIQQYVTFPHTIELVAKKVGLTPGELTGNVVAQTLDSAGAPSPSNTGTTLIDITVTSKKARKAEEAADEFARLVKTYTTLPYVLHSIDRYKVRLQHFAERIVTLQTRIKYLNQILAKAQTLTPVYQLTVATELDSAQASLGQTLDSQTTTQQLLELAQEVEETQFVQSATAQKVPTASHRTALFMGGLLGLLLGAVVALAYGFHSTRESATVQTA